MLDIKFIGENPDKVKDACKKRGLECDVEKISELYNELKKNKQVQERINAIKKGGNLKFRVPNLTPEIRLKNISDTSSAVIEHVEQEGFHDEEEVQKKIKGIEEELNSLLQSVPNIPFDDVPVGKSDADNVVLRKIGKIPNFKFPIKSYFQIGEQLGIIDIERAAKVSGTRFGYLKGSAVLIEFALVKLVFDTLAKYNFVPVLPPVMLKSEMAKGTGYFESTDTKEAYYLKEDDLYLVGTSEQPLVAMHQGEVFYEKDLPKRYVGFSSCFRREAGAYGKDTKGILRVHQFDKIEMVSFVKPEDSKKEHELLLSLQEKLVNFLKLPYQVVGICTSDMGRPAARQYDIETWFPAENKYRETHSTSNCTDFQARRLNIRYKDKAGKLNFVHTLNGTAFAAGRTIAGIIENYQQKDGSVKMPATLHKYTGLKVIR